jgi:hypothetical protein
MYQLSRYLKNVHTIGFLTLEVVSLLQRVQKVMNNNVVESGSSPFSYAPFSPVPQTDIAMWQ